ncbi:MAG: PAS domain S-box protein [Crocinitomicaceae bacterium]|nr:PAS domain S-box protein [Crocinitomicaceae bacterium]
MSELERLKRKLAREKEARKEAERILEEKSLELFQANQELVTIRDNQEAELRRQIIEIKDRERVYRNLVENATDLIYSCDTEGRITYANGMMLRFSGYTEEELIGSNFRRFVAEKYRKRVNGFYKFQLQEKLQSTYTEFPVINAEGKEVWLGQTVDLSISEGGIFNVLARDISDRKRVEKSLMLSEEKYRSIIENMELGLLEVDRNGKIIKAYPKFSKLTGYTNKELVGKDAASYFLSKEEEERMKIRNQERLEGDSEVYEVKLQKKGGGEVWVLVSGAPYYNENGVIMGSVGIHLDISFQKNLEEELRAAKAIAERSLEAKDLFLANISHEIRTPLNAIIGISELMLNSVPTPTQRKYLETIMASGDNLLCLINEILDLLKIQSGKLERVKEPTDLSEVMEHIHRSFSVIGRKKGLSVNFIDGLIPNRNYLLDATRLKEVLFNLIGNAVKFTEVGSITLEIELISSTKEFDVYSFEVADTGVGIPEEDIEKVFNIFEQASNTNTSSENGTGLGLAIANGIIENMGGELKVSSELGVGSKFRFNLSFERTNLPVEDRSSSNIGGPKSLEGYRILVVEDAEVNRFLVNTILGNWGCVIVEAINGKEAVELLKTEEFDLILMDIRMPIMNGIEASKIIRNELNLTKVPIIALTANAIQGETEKCKEAGMNDYLSKPFSQDDFYKILTKYLLAEPIIPFKNKLKSGINRKGIDSITRGDEVFQKRMVNLFVEETKLNIESFYKAITEKNEDQLKTIAHTMKAAAAHICTNDIVVIVRSIEMDDFTFEDRKNRALELIPLLEAVIIELNQAFSN